MLHLLRRPGAVLVSLLMSGLLVLASGAVLTAPASAAQISTPYPTISVEAGQTVSVDLNVTGVGERVSLEVTQKPENWQASLHGGGFRIGAVYAGPDTKTSVSLEISVPQDVKAGTYEVTVLAQAPSGDDALTVRLRVVKNAPGAFQLRTDYAKLQGAADDTFTFNLTLENNTGEKATFTLAARGPQGWRIDASPSTEPQAATVTVKPGGSSSITVDADPPDQTKAGAYTIAVRAQNESATLTKQLTVVITGSAELAVTTKTERLNASGSAGDQQTVKLVVTNKGSAPLQGIEFSASPPTDWKVEFEPESLRALPPGERAVVEARITPAGNAIAGDYIVTLTASAGSASESVDIRYTVETSGWWGLVGVIVIIAAIAGLLWAFQRYGRR